MKLYKAGSLRTGQEISEVLQTFRAEERKLCGSQSNNSENLQGHTSIKVKQKTESSQNYNPALIKINLTMNGENKYFPYFIVL